MSQKFQVKVQHIHPFEAEEHPSTPSINPPDMHPPTSPPTHVLLRSSYSSSPSSARRRSDHRSNGGEPDGRPTRTDPVDPVDPDGIGGGLGLSHWGGLGLSGHRTSLSSFVTSGFFREELVEPL